MTGGPGTLGRVCYLGRPQGSIREADWPGLVSLAQVVASAGQKQGLAHTNPSVLNGQVDEQSESRCSGLCPVWALAVGFSESLYPCKARRSPRM